MTDSFDDIRCYRESDYAQALGQVWNDPELLQLLRKIPFIPDAEGYRRLAMSFPSLQAYHYGFVAPLLKDICQLSHSQISCSGLEHVRGHEPCLFLSNHRDIVMDTLQLNSLLFENQLKPCQTAIGDNLFGRPWIEPMVRLCKSFVVKRGLGVAQQLEASRELSAYIRHTICQTGDSIWMAQREGRAKDSNDLTQRSVLKMLILSGNSNVLEDLASLRVIPLSISYEYDPCDWLKAKEMQQKRDVPGFKKAPADDLLSMLTGITGYKGRVHYHFDACISQDLLQMEARLPKNVLLQQVADRIDHSIHAHYQLYANNYIAADLLHGEQRFTEQYTADQAEQFQQYLSGQIDKIDLPQVQKDCGFLREKLLEMYANPLKNHLKALHCYDTKESDSCPEPSGLDAGTGLL